MDEYFYPEYKLVIGSFTIQEGVKIECLLTDQDTIDWVEVTLSKKMVTALDINKEDEVRLSIGYDGSLQEVFVGSVTSKEYTKIVAKNNMTKLRNTTITNSFISSIPQEIITFILERCGINNFELSDEAYPIKKLVVISKMNGIEAIRYVDSMWNIDTKKIFKADKFTWNINSKQEKIYEFNYGENIIDLQCIEKGVWELTTVAIPVTVLDVITVNNPKITGSFVVNKVQININDSGFIRTKLTFKEE